MQAGAESLKLSTDVAEGNGVVPPTTDAKLVLVVDGILNDDGWT